jgi:hypothetical protein
MRVRRLGVSAAPLGRKRARCTGVLDGACVAGMRGRRHASHEHAETSKSRMSVSRLQTRCLFCALLWRLACCRLS